jgi:uncharacterized membrane protein
MIGSPRARWRWLVGILVASLAVNAFIVGATATDFIRIKWPFGHHGGKGGSPPQLRFELAWLKGRLPPDAMASVEAAVAGAQPDALAHIERLRGLRRELSALLAAPEPDRPAIDTKLEEIRGEVAAMQADVQRVAMDAIVALPPDVRGKLVEPKGGNRPTP